jgi:hypothetical protein
VQCISCTSSASAVPSVSLFTSPTHMFTLAYHYTQAHSIHQHLKTAHTRWLSAARRKMPRWPSSLRHVVLTPWLHPGSSAATVTINHSVNHMTSPASCAALSESPSCVPRFVQKHQLTCLHSRCQHRASSNPRSHQNVPSRPTLPPQVYEQWTAGPHTPIPVTRAPTWTSLAPFPDPCRRAVL